MGPRKRARSIVNPPAPPSKKPLYTDSMWMPPGRTPINRTGPSRPHDGKADSSWLHPDMQRTGTTIDANRRAELIRWRKESERGKWKRKD